MPRRAVKAACDGPQRFTNEGNVSELVEMLRIADGKVVGTVVVLAAFYLLRHIAYRIINERVEKLNRRYAWRQTVSYAIYLLVLLIIVRLWFAWFQSVWTLLSLVAAALVIISKELLLNVVASGVIAWRQLFEIGDRIQIADRAGDVIETGLMYFSVAEIGGWVEADEPTGRIIRVPNSIVLTQAVTNYSRRLPLLWHEISVDLAATSNWERAKDIATEVAGAYAYHFTAEEAAQVRGSAEEIIFVRNEPSVHIRMREGRLNLTIRYLCKFYRRRTTEQQIWEELLARFAAEPDVRLHAAP